jgi:hypothetical protein
MIIEQYRDLHSMRVDLARSTSGKFVGADVVTRVVNVIENPDRAKGVWFEGKVMRTINGHVTGSARQANFRSRSELDEWVAHQTRRIAGQYRTAA